MKRKAKTDAERHFHDDHDVTPTRLESFALAPYSVQLQVIAALRKQTVEQNVDLTLAALILAVVLPMVLVWTDPSPLDGPWLANAIAIFIVTLVISGVFAALFGLGPWRRHHQRELAAVWLGAYEDELRRRHAARGRAARAWRATH